MKYLIMKINIRIFVVILLISHLSFLTSVSVSAQESSVSSKPLTTSYDLVHPGLLPDHPFYFLKVARDNLMGFFKGPPIDRASFALLQSDKQVAASHVLITKKQNADLAHTSFVSAQDYYEQAIMHTLVAQKEGINIQEMSAKLSQAGAKHQAILNEIEQYLDAKDQTMFDEEKEQSEKLAQMVQSLH
ncbi:MAG: hypothetical protein H0W89_03205 [Candidatus Levybacteria bacterium]|nr:hypothetical protein [Candidatus Levybacteria bacterium]